MEFEITNRRAELEAEWLRERHTDEQLQVALGELRRRGNQRPYPANIARVLGLELPTEAELHGQTPEGQKEAAEQVQRSAAVKAEALARIEALRRKLGRV